MNDLLDTISIILLLEKRRRDEGITEAEVALLESSYKKLEKRNDNKSS